MDGTGVEPPKVPVKNPTPPVVPPTGPDDNGTVTGPKTQS
jgi:hypothetical protein